MNVSTPTNRTRSRVSGFFVVLVWLIALSACSSGGASHPFGGDSDPDERSEVREDGDWEAVLDGDNAEPDADPMDGDADDDGSDWDADGESEESDTETDALPPIRTPADICATQRGSFVEKPGLFMVHPFPLSAWIAGSRLVGNTPWFASNIVGSGIWPGLIPDFQVQWNRYPASYAIAEAWDSAYVASESGIYATSTGDQAWQLRVKARGTIESLAYDAESDTLLGWGPCLLAELDSDPERARTQSSYDPLFASDESRFFQVCRMADRIIHTGARLVEYRGHAYLLSYSLDFSDYSAINRDYSLRATVFRYTGNGGFEWVCDMGDWQSVRDLTTAALNPVIHDDQLLTTTVQNEIWSFDGNTCEPYLAANSMAETSPKIVQLASLSDNLYVLTTRHLYELRNNSLEPVFDAPDAQLLSNVLADDAHERIIVSAYNLPIYHINTFLYAKDDTRDWSPLHRHFDISNDFPGSFKFLATKNGKMFAGGISRIFRHDGVDWYPMTSDVVLVDGLFTPDGETLYYFYDDDLWRIADPRQPDRREHLFALMKWEDTITEVAQLNGTLIVFTSKGDVFVQIENTFELAHNMENHAVKQALVHNGDLWMFSERTAMPGGGSVWRIRNEVIEEIDIPDFPEGYEQPDIWEGAPDPAHPERHFYLELVLLYMAEDSQGRLWIGRNDGIWLFDDESETWTKVMQADESHHIHPMLTVALTPCFDGVCKINSAATGRAESTLEQVTPDGSGGFEIYRRNLTQREQMLAPYNAASLTQNRIQMVSDNGTIMEYGTFSPLPCNENETYDLGYDQHQQTDSFDFDAYVGACTSSFAEESMACNEGRCLIEQGTYCIGGTIPLLKQGILSADEFPAQPVDIDAFMMGQERISAGEFLDFYHTQQEHDPASLIGLPLFEFIMHEYGLEWDGDTLSSIAPDDPAHFVSYPGAQAYCNSLGGRLCSAAEWEAACRGFDDDAYPWGTDGKVIQDPLEGQSDFGVLGMTLSAEYVSDMYVHDALRGDSGADEGASPMLKGEGTCMARAQSPLSPEDGLYSFRCCWDVSR